MSECQHCDGTGRIPRVVPIGVDDYEIRDGEKCNPPRWEDCEACECSGYVDDEVAA